ncbi:MAG: Asp-tRNA(Asn)/Glu-tRNA(Gln) amidotransferase subunit GatB [Bdellovibrionales bacterium]|nr:Asp-tRNA(Asn)/Glu-tRNA(Gln) amidotransferase subunit GatB [Bdellovibrionales bacterium]
MSARDWEAVIGLEIHAQLLTESKIFSSDCARYGGGDNEYVHPVSLGMPGTLPVLNQKAVEYSTKIGLALGCEINSRSVFARKNYFYPDLAKGYQISQFEEPLCRQGALEFYVEETLHKVLIERAHMEEDAGKSIHQGDATLVNYNRAGVPLLEIVSGPDMRSGQEAAEYARMMRRVLLYLEVCDGNLEEGSMRCDCNVSVRRKGDSKLGTKVELKNLNSFRFIEKAIEYEIQRQIDTIEAGESIIQETRLYDSAKNRTFSMRSKEEAHDYRYFPDPDLLPIELTDTWIENLKKTLPELPLARQQRFHRDYGIPLVDAANLTEEKDLADYFELVAKDSGNPRAAGNWIMVELVRELRESKCTVNEAPVLAKDLAKMIRMIDDGQISGKMAKAVFQEMWKSGKDPEAVVKAKGMVQMSDESAILDVICDVMAKNQAQVEEFRGGKEKVFGFFVGQVMKATKGQANPEVVNRLLQEKLKGSS